MKRGLPPDLGRNLKFLAAWDSAPFGGREKVAKEWGYASRASAANTASRIRRSGGSAGSYFEEGRRNAMNYEAILNEAHGAARAAVAAEPPEDLSALDCGFAWVTITGRGGLAAYCRSRKVDPSRYGSRAERGWQWWKPGGFPGQSIRVHEAGARAFRDALGRHGIRADLGSRLD